MLSAVDGIIARKFEITKLNLQPISISLNLNNYSNRVIASQFHNSISQTSIVTICLVDVQIKRVENTQWLPRRGGFYDAVANVCV